MTNTFTVLLKKTPNSLNISASNSDELWKKLKEQGVDWASDDVLLITLAEESSENRTVCDAVRSLYNLDVVNGDKLYLRINNDFDPNHEVYLIPSVMDGGLVEFQISNGPVNERNDSRDTYSIEDANRIFDEVVEKGWRSIGVRPLSRRG